MTESTAHTKIRLRATQKAIQCEVICLKNESLPDESISIMLRRLERLKRQEMNLRRQLEAAN